MYECILCKDQSSMTIKELRRHINMKHSIHVTSELVRDYLIALELRDKICSSEEVKTIVVEQPKVVSPVVEEKDLFSRRGRKKKETEEIVNE